MLQPNHKKASGILQKPSYGIHEVVTDSSFSTLTTQIDICYSLKRGQLDSLPCKQIQQIKDHLQKYDAKACTEYYIQPYKCLPSEIVAKTEHSHPVEWFNPFTNAPEYVEMWSKKIDFLSVQECFTCNIQRYDYRKKSRIEAVQ